MLNQHQTNLIITFSVTKDTFEPSSQKIKAKPDVLPDVDSLLQELSAAQVSTCLSR